MYFLWNDCSNKQIWKGKYMSSKIDFCMNIDVDNIKHLPDGKLKFDCNEEQKADIMKLYGIDVENDQEFLDLAVKMHGHVYFGIKDGKAVFAK